MHCSAGYFIYNIFYLFIHDFLLVAIKMGRARKIKNKPSVLYGNLHFMYKSGNLASPSHVTTISLGNACHVTMLSYIFQAQYSNYKAHSGTSKNVISIQHIYRHNRSCLFSFVSLKNNQGTWLPWQLHRRLT